MQFLSLAPFIPSGSNFESAKQFFAALGFNITWDGGGYAGFESGECKFILQEYNDKTFAENLMLTVKVDDVAAFRNSVIEKQLPEKFGIKLGAITQQPYGKEVNIIDMAGVCWHFVQ
ncbi:hypothetical protein [Ferruginibacter sp. SUN106]|uniref:hypothetical protein n=1 Tax=Ferruginibacter sp. SUN106 TaxID=2978348 RepID=UPI003D36179B